MRAVFITEMVMLFKHVIIIYYVYYLFIMFIIMLLLCLLCLFIILNFFLAVSSCSLLVTGMSWRSCDKTIVYKHENAL